MAFHVRDEATDLAVRKLARRKNKTLTAAIREACENEYEREFGRDGFMSHVREIRKKFKALSRPGGLPADKAFYDELSGEDQLTGLP